MNLEQYIGDLLYRYECVIIPNFGGFITNETSARVNKFTHTFYPPTKQISFNSHLKHNDGLLANYIASVEKIPFSEALENISKEVEQWNHLLTNEVLEISKIGSISLNKENQLIFEPTISENYLTSSFGLSSFSSPAIKRLEYIDQAEKLEKVVPIFPSEERKKKTPVFIKYAAAAAIVFAVGSFGWKTYNEHQFQNQLIAEQEQQERLEEKIQQATFVIENPLPAIQLNVTKEIKNYHIIAGAFRETENANKKVEQLLAKGYDSQILGVNKWNLTQVSYASFNSRAEALKALRTIKKNDSEDAWLLVKPF